MADSDDWTVATAIRRAWDWQSQKTRGFHFRGQFFLLQKTQRPGPRDLPLPGMGLFLGDRRERAVVGKFWPFSHDLPSVQEVRRAADELLAASVMAS